jgi:hypothetical protein
LHHVSSFFIHYGGKGAFVGVAELNTEITEYKNIKVLIIFGFKQLL